MEYRNNNNYLTIQVADQSDYTYLERMANQITERYGGRIASKHATFHEHYWEIEFLYGTLVLQMEQFVGIFIFMKDGSHDDQLHEIAEMIKIGDFD